MAPLMLQSTTLLNQDLQVDAESGASRCLPASCIDAHACGHPSQITTALLAPSVGHHPHAPAARLCPPGRRLRAHRGTANDSTDPGVSGGGIETRSYDSQAASIVSSGGLADMSRYKSAALYAEVKLAQVLDASSQVCRDLAAALLHPPRCGCVN